MASGTALDPGTGLGVATDAVERALRAGAHGAKVLHTYTEKFEVNFDTRDITLVRSTVDDNLAITVYSDTRKGSTQLTGRAHDAVDRAVVEALDAAEAGERDAANVLPEQAAEPATVDDASAPDTELMVDAVLAHLEAMRDRYPTIVSDSSFYSFVSTWRSYANSHGRTQQARTGHYELAVMASGKDGKKATSFNYVAHLSEEPTRDLLSLAAVERLYEGTVASFDARPVPSTFVGDVIFTPEAVETLVETLVGALGGVALLRKATPFLDRLGARIAEGGFTVEHAPSSLAGAPAFDGEGFVNRDLPIISDGVLENFLVDWYFSHKLDRPMTTGCGDFLVRPGAETLDDLIANTERGVLLGRYSGGSPNQNLDFSGVAKNSFYIENGKVTHPLAETMVAGNFVSVLESIRGISRETVDFGDAVNPWIATSGITVSTK